MMFYVFGMASTCFNQQENLDAGVAIDFNSSNITLPNAWASSEVSTTDASNSTVAPAESPRKYAYVSGWTVSVIL